MQIMKNNTGSRSPWSHYWNPTSIYKSQTKPACNKLLFLCLFQRYSHYCKKNTCTLIWIISLIFCFYDKKTKKRHSFSHAERKDDTQISNSRKTKSNDLDISLCRNASRLFSQLKNEGDRQEGRGKTKIEFF